MTLIFSIFGPHLIKFIKRAKNNYFLWNHSKCYNNYFNAKTIALLVHGFTSCDPWKCNSKKTKWSHNLRGLFVFTNFMAPTQNLPIFVEWPHPLEFQPIVYLRLVFLGSKNIWTRTTKTRLEMPFFRPDSRSNVIFQSWWHWLQLEAKYAA